MPNFGLYSQIFGLEGTFMFLKLGEHQDMDRKVNQARGSLGLWRSEEATPLWGAKKENGIPGLALTHILCIFTHRDARMTQRKTSRVSLQ